MPDDEEEESLAAETRRARVPWPRAAWLLIGLLAAMNLALAAYLISEKLNQSGLRQTGPALAADVPAHDSPGAAPVSNPGPIAIPHAELKRLPTVINNRAIPHNHIQQGKSKKSSVERAPRNLAVDRSRTSPGIWFNRPTTSEIHPTVPVPDPAKSPIASVPTPIYSPPVRSPVTDEPHKSEPSRLPALPSAASSNVPVSGGIRVASVGLPATDKGLVVPKAAVGPVNPKIEIVARPRELQDTPNCGGAVFIPCPTLHTRSSSTDENH